MVAMIRHHLVNYIQLFQFFFKTFDGTTPNAVLIQIWTAMVTMLLLKFLKARAKYGWHLSNLITFVRMNLLVKVGLFEWLNNPFPQIKHSHDNQLALFDSSYGGSLISINKIGPNESKKALLN